MAVMLTTIDNPYNPLNDNEYDQWLIFDLDKGYNTPALLARFSKASDEFDDKTNEILNEMAIDRIIANDFQNIYKKVKDKSQEV